MTLNLLLQRTLYSSGYYGRQPIADGALFLGGIKLCDTSESTLNLLADGTYPVVICHCHQRQRNMPIVVLTDADTIPCHRCKPIRDATVDTEMPLTCRQILPGNGAYGRKDGRIIVGRRLVAGCLLDTRQTFDRIFDRLRKAAQRGHRITLTVKTIA